MDAGEPMAMGNGQDLEPRLFGWEPACSSCTCQMLSHRVQDAMIPTKGEGRCSQDTVLASWEQASHRTEPSGPIDGDWVGLVVPHRGSQCPMPGGGGP